MCGIFGSTNLERFRTLYKMNQSRGDFAYGGLYREENSHKLQKKPGSAAVDPPDSGKYTYFIGHTQAPTSSIREFSEETAHPFQYKQWIVAHNGVLSNAPELKKKYLLEGTNDVDTSCIPALMSYFYINTGNITLDESRAIVMSLEQLEGTFSCWIYNTHTMNMYIARSGCTLYFEASSGDFSSALDPYGSYKTVPQGTVFNIRPGTDFSEVGTFKYNSPYFIL